MLQKAGGGSLRVELTGKGCVSRFLNLQAVRLGAGCMLRGWEWNTGLVERGLPCAGSMGKLRGPQSGEEGPWGAVTQVYLHHGLTKKKRDHHTSYQDRDTAIQSGQ